MASWLFLLTAGCLAWPAVAQKALQPAPTTRISFVRHVLSQEFLAEGVAVGDVNNDGKTDVLAGAYWFEAPHWQKHELAPPRQFFYDKGYSDAFVSQTLDVNLDGWLDFVRIGFPGKEAQWFENPKKEIGHWPVHPIHEAVGNESAGFADVNQDGRLDLVGSNAVRGQMTWFQAPLSPGSAAWQAFAISPEKSPGTAPFSHGLGQGDINQDGRLDVIIRQGWWEAPRDPRQPHWTFHPADLGEDCAQLYAYDFDQDGDQDVVSSSAHKRGIWWHEQVAPEDGPVQWRQHLISDLFTQSHALALADLNADGHPDLVTGKRYFAHMGQDPGEFDPPVLYWFEFKPGPRPTWQPHLIDNNSGAGVQLVVQDLTRDGFPDIVVANKKGVFFFQQQRE